MDRGAALRKRQGARLAQARRLAGYRSARAAATENGWPESTYRAHEAGTRTIGQDDAERYARRFRAQGVSISAERILFDVPPTAANAEPVPAEVRLVPQISWVSAGQLADASSHTPVEDVPLLAFADLGRGDFFALRVQGDSMDRISPEGSVIVVDRSDKKLVRGKPYVFSVRGEATYKLWEPEPPHLAPLSTNPTNKAIFVKSGSSMEVVGRVRRSVLDL